MIEAWRVMPNVVWDTRRSLMCGRRALAVSIGWLLLLLLRRACCQWDIVKGVPASPGAGTLARALRPGARPSAGLPFCTPDPSIRWVNDYQ